MKRMSLSILLIIFFCVTNVMASEEVLIARVNDWPPFYFQQNGEWVGISIDFYRALSEESGIKMEFKERPWSRAMLDMKKKPIIIGQLALTEDRKKIMNFIGPHSSEKMIIGINKKHLNNDIKNLDDLVLFSKKTGRLIAYQQDVFYSKEFNDRINTGSDFSEHFEKKASYNTVIKMLEAGRISGFLEEKTTLIYKLKYEQKSDIVVIHPFVIGSSDVYFGVSKIVSNKTLKKLHEANERLQSDGTYKKIMDKWSD
ncbi:hypothetical protein DENIS_2610 [Desulfonema ishimotonii]|uniref:Solute-binding protein family 3/N-terminal domain-containing protein n=1 Tax=Desulfonema ishimotonii TaxID=45657 RepID=A0A401FXD4_9BACT|nr:transporter substrate-binding domain-containing protein [Desulfonema ishimotonii]GBC61648.1 hypothetical protein DENIS_2610 [Desulfonema ishimotonii]